MDWFRNVEWNDKIQDHYYLKLKRAKSKGQYLRIQANYLIDKYPQVSIDLLNQYFEHSIDFDYSQACNDYAHALIRLGLPDSAIVYFEKSLNWESEHKSFLTQSYLDLPMLIGGFKIEHKYERALSILSEFENRPFYPIEKFRWNSAIALIYIETGKIELARAHAKSAVEFSRANDSGMHFHKKLGLVDSNDLLLKKMKEIFA